MNPEDRLPPVVGAALDRLDQLVREFEESPDPGVQTQVFDLLQSVDAIHRSGLRRLAELLQVAGLQRRALDDPEVRLLFDLYDLGEGGELQRASAVLETIQPYVQSHGGNLEVVEVQSGIITVRLTGACQGCAGSTATVRNVIEATLRDGLPDFSALKVVEAEPGLPRGFIPLTSIKSTPRLVWTTVCSSVEVQPDVLRAVDVENEHVLLTNVGGEIYAYRNVCPGSPFPLDSGRLENGALVCPWHGCRFDMRGGRRVDTTGQGLGVMPVAVEVGEVRIGILREGAPA